MITNANAHLVAPVSSGTLSQSVPTSRVTLVHGGSHGAWCWDPIADLLRTKGHEVRAIDLPG